MNVIADDNICKIVEKYYNLSGDDIEKMANVLKGSHSIKRDVENWVS